MKFKFLKILLTLALLIAITCCFTVDIFGSVLGKTVFFSATGLAIIILVIMAIWRPKQYTRHLILLIPILACILCFSSDLLQKTLFVNQRTSTFHFQQERKAFIIKNEPFILSEVKRIEALIANDTLDPNMETVFIDLQGNLAGDTIEQLIIKGMPYTIRRIDTDFKTSSFAFLQTNDYKLQNFSVKQGKIIKLSLYNPKFKESPYFYNSSISFYPYGNIDKEYFISEIADWGSHYYLEYCKTRNYVFEDKWIFQVEGKCFG